MKVKELMEVLKDLEPDAQVLIASQPNWPFEIELSGVVTRAELDAFVVFMLDSADSNHDGGVSLEEAQSFRLAKVAR